MPVQVFCHSALFHAGTSWRLCRIASKTEDLAIRFPALVMAKLVGQALTPELAVGALRPLLSSEDAHVRLYAATVLLRSHCLMKQCRAILLGYLGADDPDLVARAADGLGLAGESAAEALPELKRLSEEMGPAGPTGRFVEVNLFESAEAYRRMNEHVRGAADLPASAYAWAENPRFQVMESRV